MGVVKMLIIYHLHNANYLNGKCKAFKAQLQGNTWVKHNKRSIKVQKSPKLNLRKTSRLNSLFLRGETWASDLMLCFKEREIFSAQFSCWMLQMPWQPLSTAQHPISLCISAPFTCM